MQCVPFHNSINAFNFPQIASNYIDVFMFQDALLDSGVWREMNVMSRFDFIICVAVVPRRQ